ncbi:MAG: type IV pilus modification protein PilV [Mariprofundaceae bacterium]
MNERPSEKGFTLIETMISMLIVSIGLLAMAGMLITSIKANHASEIRMDASALAQSLMSRVSAKARTAAYSASTATSDAGEFLGEKFNVNGLNGGYKTTVLLNATTVSGSFAMITVKLEWDDHGSMKNVTLLSGVYTN